MMYDASTNRKRITMKKEECIALYGIDEYQRRLDTGKIYRKKNKEKVYKWHKEWSKNNPARILKREQEVYKKDGKYYKRHLKYCTTGVSGEKHKIRSGHAQKWRKYKKIIAPDSQIHHEWIPGTSEYRGVALVETDRHRHGFIDVIEILEGSIVLKTEEEVERATPIK